VLIIIARMAIMGYNSIIVVEEFKKSDWIKKKIREENMEKITEEWMKKTMKENRYIPSREIISAEARVLTAFGYFQGNNEQSFLECYMKSYLMLNFENFFKMKVDVECLPNEKLVSVVENYIKNIKKEERENFSRQLDWDLALVQSGLLEEMFNLFESKIEFAPDEIKNKKLSDIKVKNNKGEQETLSQLVLNALGITEKNNNDAYDYILNNATIQGFCLELRNAIAHNDEDDEFLKEQLAHDSNEAKENKKYAEKRYILRSDFLVELKCKYAKNKENLKKKNFGSYETIVKSKTLLNLLEMLEKACFDNKENDKIKQTAECNKTAKENYDYYKTKIEELEKSEKFKQLNISAEECYKFLNQYDHNHDFLFKQKKAIFRLCKEISENKDNVFGEFWVKKLTDKNFDVNETFFNMIKGPCSGIAQNMLYQVFTADKTEDISEDVIRLFNEKGVIRTNGIDDLFLEKGKLKESRVETITKRVRNAMQHGLYVDDFNDGISIFGSKKNDKTGMENLGHLSIDNVIQISTLKKIEEALLYAEVQKTNETYVKMQKFRKQMNQKCGIFKKIANEPKVPERHI